MPGCRVIDMLTAGLCYAFELRDCDWHTEAAGAVLRERGLGPCIFDIAGLPSPRWVTAGPA